MRNKFKNIHQTLAGGLFWLSAAAALAGPVYQPPGANLTYGDVTHGQRVQSASSNPAAAAADLARAPGKSTRGTLLSGAAGLEYGNIQDLFDFLDKVAEAYEPGDSDDAPGQDPGDKPDGGIDLGEIWDSLDPDFQEAVKDIGREVATQTALLALIRSEGYGKAWVAADVPFVLGSEHLGGAWTFGVNWSGTAKAFGIVHPIEFDEEAALIALQEWFDQLPINRPEVIPLPEQVLLTVDPVTNAVAFALENDSSMVTKSSLMTELNVGYSRRAWSNSKGNLYLGAEARLYLMRLSRLSVRFGDITDTEALFDAIRDQNFRNDNRLGVDIGALWVADNYQIGVQLTNVNEPKFEFPEVDLNPYNNERIIDFLQQDQSYTMDRQLKLEASVFTSDRRWSAHVGLDADPATDPMGDDFQWATLSVGFITDSWWIPGGRIGYRENLAGTKLRYLGIGLTAFKIVNIDISSALDTVSISGTTLPQGLMGSIGFQIAW